MNTVTAGERSEIGAIVERRASSRRPDRPDGARATRRAYRARSSFSPRSWSRRGRAASSARGVVEDRNRGAVPGSRRRRSGIGRARGYVTAAACVAQLSRSLSCSPPPLLAEVASAPASGLRTPRARTPKPESAVPPKTQEPASTRAVTRQQKTNRQRAQRRQWSIRRPPSLP